MSRRGYTAFTFSYGGSQRAAYISNLAIAKLANDDSALTDEDRKVLIEVHRDVIEAAARKAAQGGEEPDGTVVVMSSHLRAVGVA